MLSHCLLFTAKASCACVHLFPPALSGCQACSPMTYLSAALWEQRLFFESEQQIKILISSAGLQRDNVLFGRLLLCKKGLARLSTRHSSVINFYHRTGIRTQSITCTKRGVHFSQTIKFIVKDRKIKQQVLGDKYNNKQSSCQSCL